MLSETEAVQARALGWELIEVYDLKTEKIDVAVFPADGHTGSQPELVKHVIQLAKSGNKVALKTLQLIVKYKSKSKRK